MDILYLFKNDVENDSEELRYSLRSLQNIPHGRVIIAGEKPSWVRNVTFIPVEQSRTKDENVAMNLYAAVHSDLMADTFVLMNDDFFIMKKIDNMPMLILGSMPDVIARYDQRYPEGSEYINTMKKLYIALVKQGIKEPLSYEMHTPMVMEKRKVAQLYARGERLYQIRSFYGNYYHVGGTVMPDVKVFMEARHNNAEYNKDPVGYLDKQTFLSATGGSFKRGLVGEYIKSKLNDKSIYEA